MSLDPDLESPIYLLMIDGIDVEPEYANLFDTVFDRGELTSVCSGGSAASFASIMFRLSVSTYLADIYLDKLFSFCYTEFVKLPWTLDKLARVQAPQRPEQQGETTGISVIQCHPGKHAPARFHLR